MSDIVVVGGGLAGLTAGLTAARLGRSVLVLTGGVPGGLLLSIDRIEGVPGFPEGIAGYELCPATQEAADDAGVEFGDDEATSLEQSNGGWSVGGVDARAVILATGASFKKLGVPGEERLLGHGISTCASCDGPLLGGKTAAVVGGGDSALQEALTLTEAGVSVVVLCRELVGQETYRRRVAEAGIDVRRGVEVEEILGAGTVEGVRLRGGDELTADAVFPFVGLQPNSERFAAHVELDERGAIRSGAPGIFAAGVVRSGATGRAAAAAGDGAAAAVAADAYLKA